MHLPFDILKKERDGSFRWFEAVNDLGSANIRIREIIALSPGDYIVFDQRSHNIIPLAPSSCRASLPTFSATESGSFLGSPGNSRSRL
jgi:hypothetical protein